MTTLEEKVQLLLDEEKTVEKPKKKRQLLNKSEQIVLPPLIRVEKSRTRVEKHMTSADQAELIARLTREKTMVTSPPPVQVPKTLLNPRSAEMTRDLEPIAQRYPKLLAAQQQRRKELVRAIKEKEFEENLFTPQLCETSRIWARQSTPEFRRKLAETRFQKIIREVKEKERYTFQPKLNRNRRDDDSQNISVIDRMMEDVQKRQLKKEVLKSDETVILKRNKIVLPKIAYPEYQVSSVDFDEFVELNFAPVDFAHSTQFTENSTFRDSTYKGKKTNYGLAEYPEKVEFAPPQVNYYPTTARFANISNFDVFEKASPDSQAHQSRREKVNSSDVSDYGQFSNKNELRQSSLKTIFSYT